MDEFRERRMENEEVVIEREESVGRLL